MPAFHQLADADQPSVDVEAHDVAHQIVARVAARDREGCEDEAADLAQVAGKLLADLLLEDLQRRPPVQLDQDVGPAVADLVDRADRHAALAECGGDGNGVRQEDAGDPALGDAARDLRGHGARRREAADQEAVQLIGEVGDDVARALVARVGVNDAEVCGCAGNPCTVRAAELPQVVADGLEDPVTLLVEVCDHDRCRGLVEILSPGRADADADRTHPLVDAGRALEPVQRGGEMIANRIGHVEHAEALLRQCRAQPLDAGLDGGFAGRPAGVGEVKSRHPLRPGAMEHPMVRLLVRFLQAAGTPGRRAQRRRIGAVAPDDLKAKRQAVHRKDGDVDRRHAEHGPQHGLLPAAGEAKPSGAGPGAAGVSAAS